MRCNWYTKLFRFRLLYMLICLRHMHTQYSLGNIFSYNCCILYGNIMIKYWLDFRLLMLCTYQWRNARGYIVMTLYIMFVVVTRRSNAVELENARLFITVKKMWPGFCIRLEIIVDCILWSFWKWTFSGGQSER